MANKSERTRTKILDAAQQTVLDRGFAATSVDAIQAAAGISRGTFFYHYPSKDDLSRALIERYAQSDRELTDAYMARAQKLSADPAHQVLIFLALHEELFEQMEGVYPGCLFASYSYEAGLFDATTMKIVDEALEYWTHLVGAILERAIKIHEPAIASDPFVLADTAYAIFQGAFILSKLRNDPSIVIAQIRQVRNYFELLFGLRMNRDGNDVANEGART